MAKSDKTTVRKRIDEMIGLLLAGALWHEIRQYSADQGWNLKDRQLRRYQELAYQQLTVTLDRDRDRNITRHLCQRRALYARAMSVSDFRTALSVAKDEAELLGLYGPQKLEMSGPNGTPIATLNAHVSLTDDDRDRALHALMARLGQADSRPLADGATDADRPILGPAGSTHDSGRDDAGPLAASVTPLDI